VDGKINNNNQLKLKSIIMKNKITITSFIRLVALTLLILGAIYIVKPFVGALTWAIILAVAIYPFYQKLVAKASIKRKKVITTLFTLITVALLAIPTYSIFSSVLSSTTEILQQLKNDTLEITPPSENVKDWPMGGKIYTQWKNASVDAKAYAITHKEFILEKGKGVFGSFIGIMGTLVGLIISLIIAVVFMSKADKAYISTVKLANKIIGKDGEEMVIMSRDTIRSVVKGILLVAIIQALLSFIGFKLIGLPAAGLFTMLVLFSAIVQIPVTLAVIPAIALAFSVSDNSTYAIIFTVYIIIVSLLDNVLKPILLAKGLQTPTLFILLGAIGGVMLYGIIGLFMGPVILALMHQFYLRWVNDEDDKVLAD
jgi:predicted PurR-regulated permease PerM